jgi:flagellin
MGLRINTNTSSLEALRNLHLSDRAQQQSLLRLSSGLRINSGADDPSGLVISERLRAQIAALKQDSANSQNATNLVSTADASLQKVSDLLNEIQRSVQFALNTGGASPEQIAAEQDSVDQAVQGINRVSATTRYGDRALLNGASAYKVASPGIPVSGGFQLYNDLNLKSISFVPGATSRNLAITNIAIALGTGAVAHAGRGSVLITDNTAVTTTLRISGSRGTADVTVAASAVADTIGAAINTVADRTGVVYDTASNSAVTANIGSSEFTSVQVIGGALTGGGLTTVGAAASGVGTDATLSFEGVTYTAKGLSFSINSPDANFEFNLNPDLTPITAVAPLSIAAPAALTVQNTGLAFQLREQATSADRMSIGIDSMTSASLGLDRFGDVISSALQGSPVNEGGFLSSLMTGAGNDLTQNAANALNIVNAAASKVATTRGFLGAAVAFNLQPNIDSIEVATQNLSSSLSSLRDLDFAEETANFTRTQILFQSGIAALASARTIPQAVLQLLGR